MSWRIDYNNSNTKEFEVYRDRQYNENGTTGKYLLYLAINSDLVKDLEKDSDGYTHIGIDTDSVLARVLSLGLAEYEKLLVGAQS